MRICDWSSAVCSSYLPDRELTLDSLGEAVSDIDRLIGVFNALLRLSEIDSGLRGAGFTRVDLAELVDDQIGRESSRERGCQDGVISVMAAPLKKKKEQNIIITNN